MDPAAFLEGHPVALSVYEKMCNRLGALGAFDVRTTKSQIAFRCKRGFAYLWLPGQYLQHPGAEALLSIALGGEVRSGRFMEVVHPAELHWMHHLEVHRLDAGSGTSPIDQVLEGVGDGSAARHR